MPNIFDVGVKLSLASNVGAGLRVIARDLMGIRTEVGKTQADMNRLRTIMIGGAMFTVGTVALRSWWDLAKAGDRIIQQRQRMISQGIDLATVQANYVAALRAAATIEGTTVAGNLALISTLRATVGTSAAARAVLPGTAKDEWILRRIGQGPGDIAGILKSIEMLRLAIGPSGKISPQRFQHALDLMVAGLNLDPKALLTGRGVFQFARMAQPIAALGGNAEQFVRDYFELVTQMGRTAGRGIAYMGIKLVGGRLTKAQEATLLRLGLVTPAGIGGTKGHPALKVGAIKGFDELVHQGILAWFRDVFLPAAKLKFGGEVNASDMSNLLSAPAGFPVTSQRALATFFNIAPMVGKFNEQLDKELPKLDDIFSSLQSTLTAQLGDLDAALGSFFEVLGVPAAEAAIPFLKNLTGGIQDLTLTLGENPWLADVIDALAVSIGTMLSVAGGMMIARGAFGMLKLAIPNLAAALGPFAAGGVAAIALRILTSPAGLLGLAAGIEALGASAKSIPPWLIHALSGAATGAAITTKTPLGPVPGALAGAAAGGLWGLDPLGLNEWYWSPLSPFSLTHAQRLPVPPSPPMVSLPLPPLPALLPLPLPPLPPRGVHVTINSAPQVTLPLPPMSPADLRSALQQALIQGIDPNTLAKIAGMIAQEQANDLRPLLEDVIQKSLAPAVAKHQQHEKRRTFLDWGTAFGSAGL